jgi:hypothetical protein
MGDVTGQQETEPEDALSIGYRMLDMLDSVLLNRRRAVAYRIKIGGVQVEADTAEEVFELLKGAEGRNGDDLNVSLISVNRIVPAWTAAAALKFYESIHTQSQQLRVFLELSRSTHGVFKEDLVKKVTVNPQQLGGILAGLAKNAKKFCTAPLFVVEKLQINKKRTCRYNLALPFRVAFISELTGKSLENMLLQHAHFKDEDEESRRSADEAGGAVILGPDPGEKEVS